MRRECSIGLDASRVEKGASSLKGGGLMDILQELQACG